MTMKNVSSAQKSINLHLSRILINWRFVGNYENELMIDKTYIRYENISVYFDDNNDMYKMKLDTYLLKQNYFTRLSNVSNIQL